MEVSGWVEDRSWKFSAWDNLLCAGESTQQRPLLASQLWKEPFPQPFLSPFLGLRLDADLKDTEISQTKHFKVIPGNSGLVFSKQLNQQFQSTLSSEFETIQGNKYELIKELCLLKKMRLHSCYWFFTPTFLKFLCFGKTESAFDGMQVEAPLYCWHNM